MDWKKFKEGNRHVEAMEKLVMGYSYADEQQSIVTDEKVCHLIVKGIREAKARIFSMIDLLYELEKKEPLSRQLQKLKDELDIFSDEVKARYCEWGCLDGKWMAMLVKHDHDIASGLKRLNSGLQAIYEKLLGDKALMSGSRAEEKVLWESVKKKLPAIEKRVDSLVARFKEREGICNLRPLALEKTYGKIREKIGRQI